MIFDLSQPGTSKKEKSRVFWGLKKEKLYFCKWQYFFYVTQIHAWNIQYKNCWESFVLKLWLLNSIKPASQKMKESEYFED